MILQIILIILLGLALLYFIGQSIYYYNKTHKLEKRIEELEILLASFLKKSISEGTQPNTTILLDSHSYDKIMELLDK